jgi:hypothetical protein
MAIRGWFSLAPGRRMPPPRRGGASVALPTRCAIAVASSRHLRGWCGGGLVPQTDVVKPLRSITNTIPRPKQTRM